MASEPAHWARGHAPWVVRAPAIVQLMRPLNCAMTAFGVAVGAYVQAGASVGSMLPQAGLAALAGFAFAGAGNALNDWMDRATDRAAHPERPLPSGRATARDALRLQTLLFTLSAVAASLVSVGAFLFVLVAMVLMVGYEVRLKARGLPGNLAIALLTAAPFAFGALAMGGLGTAALILALLAALTNLGREIVKDVEDMAGDVGRRTLPMRIGPDPATRFAQVAVLAGIALSPLPALAVPPLGLAYLPLVALADGALLAGAVRAGPHPRSSQKLLKAGMLLGLVAFAAGRFTA